MAEATVSVVSVGTARRHHSEAFAACDSGTDLSVGYSGEEERARVFCDLMRMAFA